MAETARFVLEITLSTQDNDDQLGSDEWVQEYVQETFSRTELDCLESRVVGRTGELDALGCLQIPIVDVTPGMEVWNIHDQKWVTVERVFDNGHEIELDYGPAVISAESDHLMFTRKTNT